MLLKVVRYWFYWLYLAIIINLPANFRPFGRVFRSIRYLNVNIIIENCGENINVEKGALFSPNIKIGDRSMLGEDCRVYGGTEIGADVMMGPDVKIYTRNHNFKDKEKAIHAQGDVFKKVTIGDDVWIGANSIILPGVIIGKGAVIGAGSIVTKTIPEYAICCGNPAVVKGYR